ncbi:hypothetical protein FSP39_020732 [Pinctada imbricata]|uniref:SWIM-type domain-containing protein n=1 Tax=Pinctada imbricata TaxID=66713 RepID=A0AA88XLN8_PINIB|nr:hypothetical protein FSP39_020732 [Pinctada imbricata]
MAAESQNKRTVPEMKEFLAERGIQTSIYNKDQLIKLVEAASELGLETEADPEEEKSQHDEERRTVTMSTGITTILPDVKDFTEWQCDLTTLPTIEIGDIMVYLLTNCGWIKTRLSSYKEDNGYKLFENRHIDTVMLKNLNEFTYIKSTCLPETRQNEKPYQTWILLGNDGSVKSGGCTCVADDGSCKHCVALLFSLNNFCERHKDRGTETCTDTTCRWDRPRTKSNPVTLQGLTLGSNNKRDKYTPVSTDLINSRSENLKKNLYNVCRKYGSVFCHTVEYEDSENEDVTNSNNNFFPLPEIIQNYKSKNEVFKESELFQYLRAAHSTQMIEYIEQQTREQSDSDIWYSFRKGRITASIMGSVLNCNIERLSPDNYIVRKIQGTNNFFSTKATDYGKAMENVARSQYSKKYCESHIKSQVSHVGLCISPKQPFIAASPDGLVRCQCCGEGLLEIKCTFTHQHKYTKQIASEENYNVLLENGQVKLKRNCSWYCQIQTQLFATGKSWCDFVLFTHKDIAIDRIYFNEEFFDRCLNKATAFFLKFLI